MNSVHAQAINTIKLRENNKKGEVSGEVTINFHPDRLTLDGRPLLSSIAHDGYIKSQFESGTSNGGLSPFIGGDRYAWEQRVFDGIYDSATAEQRPKYGGFNYLNQEFGASPRFGSCYFILQPEIIERTTFCYPDSFFLPDNFSSHQGLKHLVDLAKGDDVDLLDNYIEAQIHGHLSVKQDVRALILDPAYKDTQVEALAKRLNLDIGYHAGFRLEVNELNKYPDYRGQKYVQIAHEIARDGVLTPALLSKAIYEKNYDEQDIKKVWHYLARFGYQG